MTPRWDVAWRRQPENLAGGAVAFRPCMPLIISIFRGTPCQDQHGPFAPNIPEQTYRHRPVTSAENYAPSRRGTQRVVSFQRADIVSKLLRSRKIQAHQSVNRFVH
jgi:hypothetical protein